MSLLDGLLEYLRGDEKKSAAKAKERLQFVLVHKRDRRDVAPPDYLPALQEELLAVIAKYIPVDRSALKVHLGKRDEYDEFDVLELNITLPETGRN
ncbi:MAG: cell division topological specificity factor MinE [Gallionella sp.]|nr:cell division topological specificity factor MinE [Gallionella sp.]